MNVWTGKNRPAGWGRTDTNVVQKVQILVRATIGKLSMFYPRSLTASPLNASRRTQNREVRKKKLGLGPFERETVVYYFEKVRIH